MDVSLQAHAKEVANDSITNPVVQANKRAARTEADVNFLAGQTSEHQVDTLEEEQIALIKEHHGNSLHEFEPEFDANMEIERASDDESDEEATLATAKRGAAGRRGRRIHDSDYHEDEAEAQANDSDAPMDDLEAEVFPEERPAP